MKISIDISAQSSCPISETMIRQIITDTLAVSGFDFGKQKNVLINVVFVTPQKIRSLNRQYRKKDVVTDVLSFSYLFDKQAAGEVFLGELIVCCSFVKKSAKINKVTFQGELAYILSHGTLHLLGLEHGEKMFAMQDAASHKYIWKKQPGK